MANVGEREMLDGIGRSRVACAQHQRPKLGAAPLRAAEQITINRELHQVLGTGRAGELRIPWLVAPREAP